MLPPIFEKYAALFEENGFSLYMVGGSSRDYLLGRAFTDYDLVTDATPEQMKSFLPTADFTFARFGSIKLKEEGNELDFTTLRVEGEYLDSRHPSSVSFVREPSLDYRRRDFTINAIYIDKFGHTLDFSGGLDDLHMGIIRFIGDPRKRIEEDPLRILRAERFARKLGFAIEAETQAAIEWGRPLLEKLNPQKVQMELKKG
ncbi:MAG: hypothetical protein Q4F15_02980 [Bacillota bacterium]|nr:hypothetical protein [Bacillota bacterium]